MLVPNPDPTGNAMIEDYYLQDKYYQYIINVPIQITIWYNPFFNNQTIKQDYVSQPIPKNPIIFERQEI